MSEKFTTEGHCSRNDAEKLGMSAYIFNLLVEFGNPKDCSTVVALVHLEMIKGAFPPDRIKEAFDAIDIHAKLLKDELNRGWK